MAIRLGRSIVAFILGMCCFVLFRHLGLNSIPGREPFASFNATKLQLAVNNVKRCVIDKNVTDFFEKLTKIINECLSRSFRFASSDFITLDVKLYGENKRFIDYLDDYSGEHCSYLTVGIGGNIKAEENMQKIYPHCQFFGLDPEPLQGQIYKKVGTYIPFGFSSKRGRSYQIVRKPGGKYAREKVRTISAQELMGNYLKTNMIHFATIDVEGHEFTLLANYSKTFEDAGLTICQMDIELHGRFLRSEKVIYPWIRKFLEKTTFIPVAAANYLKHRKVTFYNTVHICNELFRLERFV